jgi:hypothetical protein
MGFPSFAELAKIDQPESLESTGFNGINDFENFIAVERKFLRTRTIK